MSNGAPTYLYKTLCIPHALAMAAGWNDVSEGKPHRDYSPVQGLQVSYECARLYATQARARGATLQQWVVNTQAASGRVRWPKHTHSGRWLPRGEEDPVPDHVAERAAA